MPRARRSRRPAMKKPRRRLAVRKSPALARQVHVFKRSAYLGTQTASISAVGGPTPIAVSYAMALNQMPNFSEFTTLFDQYKITGAKLSFTPTVNMGVLNPAATQTAVLGYSKVHSIIDYDDAAVPVSEDSLLEYGSLKSTAPFATHSRFIKPKVLHEIYRSALTTAYAPRASTYLDMSNADVPHYGLKFWVSAPNSPIGVANSISYKVYLTLYFTCKNTR